MYEAGVARPKIQRSVEAAVFAAPRGPIPIARLMAMSLPQWDHLRIEITRRWQDNPADPLARCLLCNRPVYISARGKPGAREPVYVHFQEEANDCPWHDRKLLRPDDPRAAQYLGHQESALHRELCQLVAELIRRDPRTRSVTVETYRRPTVHERGRFPDVCAEFDRLPPFAFELQLSKPFAPEIAARSLFYEREGVGLIWLFHEIAPQSDADLPQGFLDVVMGQRGNAFVVDAASFEASAEANELLIQCYVRHANGFYAKPKLVSLDDLTIPEGRPPYFEDKITPELVARGADAREKWWPALKAIDLDIATDPFLAPSFGPAHSSIVARSPALSRWKKVYWDQTYVRARSHLNRLFAILFSIAASARKGTDRNYVTRNKGAGSLVAMLNSKLSSAEYRPYAAMIERMLERTAASDRLEKASLQNAIAVAKREAIDDIVSYEAVWEAAEILFPEVFDGVVRGQLLDLGTMPEWARPAPPG